MPAVLIAAADPLSGKTTVAVALAQRLAADGRSATIVRLAGDGHSPDDARLFGGLPFNAGDRSEPVEPGDVAVGAGLTLIEAGAGDARELAHSLSARAVVVAAYADPLPADIPSFCEALGRSCAGVAITRVPERRLQATRVAASALGVQAIALIPEDRTLAAPCLGHIAATLEAESSFLNSSRENVIDRPIISSISADPAQGYFAQYNPNAVIVRGDKPDQQLAALNAGAPCLIVTGGLPILSYVEERAEEEEVPILRTRYDTIATVGLLETLWGATPFTGQAKVERIAQLADQLDISWLA